MIEGVEAPTSEHLSSTDPYFDPDPRFQLFTQKTCYDKLQGSYLNEPMGSFYPSELDKEINHTLNEAWRFNPFALSKQVARETVFRLARTPAHGLERNVVQFVKSYNASRLQAMNGEKESDDTIARKFLQWENYLKLDEACPADLDNPWVLQKVLDEFYDPPNGGLDCPNGRPDSHNVSDNGNSTNACGSPKLPSHELHLADESEKSRKWNGSDNSALQDSVLRRRGWLALLPTALSKSGPPKHLVTREDRGCSADSLSTPDTSNRDTQEDSCNGQAVFEASSPISPPLTATADASPIRSHVMVPAAYTTPRVGAIHPANHTPIPITPVNRIHLASVPSTQKSTFKAKLAPMEVLDQTGEKLALFGDNGELRWQGIQEVPYDFNDYFSGNSDLSETLESSLDAQGTSGATSIEAAHLDVVRTDEPSASDKLMLRIDGNTNAANPQELTTPAEVITEVATDVPVPDTDAATNVTIMEQSTPLVVDEAVQEPTIPTRTPEQAKTLAQGLEPTTSAVADKDVHEPTTPKGNPEQAITMAPDLEQSIDSAISQAATLAHTLSRPSSLNLPEPVVAVSWPYNHQTHDGIPNDTDQPMDLQEQSELVELTLDQEGERHPPASSKDDPEQNEDFRQEPQHLSINGSSTPIALQPAQAADHTMPNTVHPAPEDDIDSVSTTADSLSVGVASSPTYETESGRNALSHYINKTSSVKIADPTMQDPEDMALTPTDAEFGQDNWSPEGSLEEVSLIEESPHAIISGRISGTKPSAFFSTIKQPYRSPYATPASKPNSNTFVPSAISDTIPTTPVQVTPNSLAQQPHNPLHTFQPSTTTRTPTLVLPTTTPGTPTPAAKAPKQRHTTKPLTTLIRHSNPGIQKNMQKLAKSVKNVFKSAKLATTSPTPPTASNENDPFVLESGEGSRDEAVKRSANAKTMVQTSPITPMREPRKGFLAEAQSGYSSMSGQSQDPVAKSVVVPNKRKMRSGKGEGALADGTADLCHGQGRKKPRRSMRNVEQDALKKAA